MQVSPTYVRQLTGHGCQTRDLTANCRLEDDLKTLTLTRPDDWHLHLRDGPSLRDVLGHTARVFGRAIVMPNLKPPVTTVAEAAAYRDRILAVLPADADFEPLMTLYLTDATTPAEIKKASQSDLVYAIKLYPAGATTNSSAGVQELEYLSPTLDAMAEEGLPLLVHGEVTDPDIDLFDREAAFLDTVLGPLLEGHPTLRVVMEHATTADAVSFVRAHDNVGCTITPQHLVLNRNALFAGGLQPHNYCLPVLKRERHRIALVEAATSGDQRFFLGTDSAPHTRPAKETACGCAGCFSAAQAMPLYATAFEAAGALDMLEGFASHHGPDWYGLPRNAGTLTLVPEETALPPSYPFTGDEDVRLLAGQALPWRVA